MGSLRADRSSTEDTQLVISDFYRVLGDRIRAGTADMRIMTAMRIRDACGRLLTRTVSIDELFDKNDPQSLKVRQ
jgi:hypothetical protein